MGWRRYRPAFRPWLCRRIATWAFHKTFDPLILVDWPEKRRTASAGAHGPGDQYADDRSWFRWKIFAELVRIGWKELHLNASLQSKP